MLLALFFMNSLTTDFAVMLHSCIDPKDSPDGPLLLFVMCARIHRNHLTFMETIKNKVHLATLFEYMTCQHSFIFFKITYD